MHGEADDAPGLALIGILLIVGALAVAVRVAQRKGVERTGLRSLAVRVVVEALRHALKHLQCNPRRRLDNLSEMAVADHEDSDG